METNKAHKNNTGIIFAALIAVSVILGVVIIVSQPISSSKRPTLSLAMASCVPSIPEACDNGSGEVYLMLPEDHVKDGSTEALLLMSLLKKWERQFPNKRVVTMVTMTDSSGGNTWTVGLLVHYETAVR